MTDPIADLLTRIRNAYLARHQTIVLPYSKLKENLVKVLIKNNYLQGYQKTGIKPKLNLSLDLKYNRRQPAITEIIRYSKPGVRHYSSVFGLNKLIKRRGSAILSTSSGLMTAKEAKKLKLGGEIICFVK